MKQKMVTLDKCAVCGRTADEHLSFGPYAFVPIRRPESCTCDPLAWQHPDEIPPVCDYYKGNGIQDCMTCEHDKACHKGGSE
jgi:hypothetical protein